MATDLRRAHELLASRPELASNLLIIAGERQMLTDPMRSADLAVMQVLRKTLLGKSQEHFMAFVTDPLGRVVDSKVMFIGTEEMVTISPKILFSWILSRNAAPHRFYVAHNHPDATSLPSDPDVQLTDRLLRISLLLGVEFADHFVLGADGDVASIRDLINSRGSGKRDYMRDDLIRKLFGEVDKVAHVSNPYTSVSWDRIPG